MAVENQRDEDVADGALPQAPTGEGIAARRDGGYWVAAEGDGKARQNLPVEVRRTRSTPRRPAGWACRR